MSTNLSVVQCLVKVCGKIALINRQLLVSACQDNPLAFTLIVVDDDTARNSTVEDKSLVANFKLSSFFHCTLLLLLICPWYVYYNAVHQTRRATQKLVA